MQKTKTGIYLCQKSIKMEKRINLPPITVGLRLGAGAGQFHIVDSPSGSHRKWKVEFKKRIDSKESETLGLSESVIQYLQRAEEIESRYYKCQDSNKYFKNKAASMENLFKEKSNELSACKRELEQMRLSGQELVSVVSKLESQRKGLFEQVYKLENKVSGQTDALMLVNRNFEYLSIELEKEKDISATNTVVKLALIITIVVETIFLFRSFFI